MARKTKHKGRQRGDWIRIANERGRKYKDNRYSSANLGRCFCGQGAGVGMSNILTHFTTRCGKAVRWSK